MATEKPQKGRKPLQYEDFKVILDLPEERGARCLRELLHVSVTDWRLCMDKIRQYKEGGDKTLPPRQRLYHEYRTSKGPGKGYRYFAAPHPVLKNIQRAIHDRFLVPTRVHFCRHGGQVGTSIVTNAEQHAGYALTMFNVDIINAFPTIKRSRVRANLKRPFTHALREFATNFTEAEVAAILEALVDLVVLHDRLPQGPPTSPRLLDICCRALDRDLYQLVAGSSSPLQTYRLTAYVDDYTISSDGEMPAAVREAVIKAIRKRGFIPHSRPDKCHYYSPQTGEVLTVTGLIVWQDGRITIPPKKLKVFRARLHALLRRAEWDTEAHGQVTGTLAFIGQFYGEDANLPSEIRALVQQCKERIRAGRLAVLEQQAPSTQAASELLPKPPRAPRKKKTSRKSGGNGHAKDSSVLFDEPALTAGAVC